MLFTSVACMTPRNLELMVIGGFHLDPVDATHTLERLQALSTEHAAELFYSHHMESFDSWLKAPIWYQ